MKNSILRKIVLVTGVGIMLGAFVLVPDDYPWYYELIVFNIGMFMWLFSSKKALSKFKKSSKKSLVFVALSVVSITSFSQDYSAQVEAFRQSFENKDIAYVKPHIQLPIHQLC